MKNNFYHVIGQMDRSGRMHYKLGYRIEKIWYEFRQFVAFLIFPEWRERFKKERYNLDYIVRQSKKHYKDVRGRDKAIFRLQKQNKKLRQLIRQNFQIEQEK